MTWSATDRPPERREARVMQRGSRYICGGCGGTLQEEGQWRCPYVECRKWLYGTLEPPRQVKRSRDPELAE